MAERNSMLKGINDIKTVHTIKKAAARQKGSNDFLRLYMLEMERTRLISEKNKLIQRLEVIDGRLSAIQEVYAESLEGFEAFRSYNGNRYVDDVTVPGFKTMPFDY
ncbi:hypothetical protein [Pelodictyon luteolum]|uniref:Uncharacterized protein n=1 Tax=Chlorobium luteolum (strain DSM 273 / BCRC 81028 / 2530) TaxID=319225 RepID=Q3B510_CHLL3|nr:hypothetical protein [Pelodictyon luteolum]ABB23571.1 hypothetical protein Plut_0693 [Pelodictyon luteolum DSM 273]